MAITNIKGMKTEKALGNSEKYIANKEKTIYMENVASYIKNAEKTITSEEEQLVSGYNCDPTTFKIQAQMLMDQYYQNKDEGLAEGMKSNYAYHIILSFKQDKTELDPKLVQQMAGEFCQKLLKDDFIALYAVHMNTDNLHAHILVPAYALDGHHKYYDNKKSMQKMRDIADEIALSHGLEIIVNPKQKTGKSHYEYTKAQENSSWKQDIKSDILSIASQSKSFAEYKNNMAALGYTLTEKQYKNGNKGITYEKDGHKLSDNRLPLECRQTGITNLIFKNIEKQNLKELKQKVPTSAAYRPIPVSNYDPYTGHRSSGIFKIFELMKKLIEAFKAGFESAALEELYPNNPNYKSYQKKLDMVKVAEKALTKLNINTIQGLDLKGKSVLRDQIKTKQSIEKIQKQLERSTSLDEMLGRYQELAKEMHRLCLSDNRLHIGRTTDFIIRHNLQKLDPPDKKDIERLYIKLKGKPYKTAFDISLMTATQIKEAMQFLNNPDEKKPDVLIGKDEKSFNSNMETGEAEAEAVKIQYKDYSKEDQLIIKEYEKLAYKLREYGIDNSLKAKAFRNQINDLKKEVSTLEQHLQEAKDTQKTLNYITNILNKATDKGFVFGPLYKGNATALTEQVQQILMSDYRYNELLTMKQQLQEIRRGRAPVYAIDMETITKPNFDELQKVSKSQLDMIEKLKTLYPILKDLDPSSLSFNAADKLIGYVAYQDEDNKMIDEAIQNEINRMEREEQVKEIQSGIEH